MDEAQTGTSAQPGKSPGSEVPARTGPSIWARKPIILFGTIGAGVLLYFGLGYLVESFTHEWTDDAFLDANLVSIAPKVAGQVKQVPVRDNQAVKEGELLVEIDPCDLQVQLDQKHAALKAAQENVELMKATVELFRAQIAAAEATAKQTAAEAAASQATYDRARADLKRANDLIHNQTISPQEFDSATANAAEAEANLKAAQEKASSDAAKVAQARAQLMAGTKGFDRAEAQTSQAEKDEEAAKLNLSYARVLAPTNGIVTRKAVEGGDYVQVGQRLMALVPPALYVTANFKETQLQRIRTNQIARIRIDCVTGRTFAGHVESIQAGSGARFSLLPPENAVGNYVKVVQRVPVKIVFDEPLTTRHVLGPGMSVVPSVHVTGFEIRQAVIVIASTAGALALGGFWLMLAGRRRGG